MAYPSVTNTFANSTTIDASQVNANFSDLVNGLSDASKDLSMNAATFAGTLTANGAVNLGNATSDDITITGSLASSLSIKTTFSYDLGTSAIGWKSFYLGSNDSAARTVRIIAGAVSSSYTITLPTAVAAANNYKLVSTTGGVTSWAANTAMTSQRFTSGSGTYTTPTGVLYLKVRLIGGGGGGAASATGLSAGQGGSTGGDTTFSTITGSGGPGGAVGTSPGVGGAASGGDVNIPGGSGGSITIAAQSGGNGPTGFCGGTGPFGGAGGGGLAGQAGSAGAANSGAGGGGGGASGSNVWAGSGGNAGGYCEKIITSPSSTYSYAVGAGGAAGTFSGGASGGAGAAGIIIVEEHYV